MKIKVLGMMCNGCANRVKNALTSLGASNIEINLESKEVSFTGELDTAKVKEEIENLGFEFVL